MSEEISREEIAALLARGSAEMTREEAYKMAIKACESVWNDKTCKQIKEALEQEPTIEAYKQVCKERDIAIEQLHELGYEWGQKIEPCEDAISRQTAIDACNQSINILEATDRIKDLPSATSQPKTVLCKDCKYFDYDSTAKVDGIPLIVAHEICNRWGDGCKTNEDGWCFLAEKREEQE